MCTPLPLLFDDLPMCPKIVQFFDKKYASPPVDETKLVVKTMSQFAHFFSPKIVRFQVLKNLDCPLFETILGIQKRSKFSHIRICAIFRNKNASALVANANLVIKIMPQFAHFFIIFRCTWFPSRSTSVI